jgi:hypothetical protein
LPQTRFLSYNPISGSFKGEAAGSDKRFSFRLASIGASESVHVFEGAIDALSFATLVLNRQIDWQKLSLLALGVMPPSASSASKTVGSSFFSFIFIPYCNSS